MDFYALNATPINGWQTHQGFGAAEIEVAGQAVGHLHVHPKGEDAAITVSGQASGLVAKTGQTAADIVLSASGVGYAIIHGFGQADINVLADADGKIIPFMGGKAHIVLSAQANGRIAQLGVGAAYISIDAFDAGRLAVRGHGQADIEIDAAYGIPDPITIPDDYEPAHPHATMSLGREDRTMDVPPDRWPMQVPPERDVRIRRGARCLP